MNFTVLISAYSINPYKALDDGIAWSIVQALDQKFRLIVVTHPGNRRDIEKFLASSPEATEMQTQFEYYAPFPGAIRSRPSRTLLQKYRWHWGVVSYIRQRKLHFDLAHHLSFPCGWCPSFLWRLNKPLIWGPVGYPPPVPVTYIRPYGWLTLLKDRICWGIKKGLWFLDPFVRISAKKAAHVFVIDQQVEKELKLRNDCTTVLSCVPIYQYRGEGLQDGFFKTVAVGPFNPHAGFDLTIRAFADFYRQLEEEDQGLAELVIIGRGPFKHKLEQIARSMHLPEQKIRIIESEDYQLIDHYLSRAHVFFSPNHDSMDRLLPQALAYGLPVISFDRQDVSQIVNDCCSLRVPYGVYDESVQGFSDCLQRLFLDKELLKRLSQGAHQKFNNQLTWAARGDAIAEVYWNVYRRQALVRIVEEKSIASTESSS